MFRCVSDLNCLGESNTVVEEDGMTVVTYRTTNDSEGQQTNTTTEYDEVQRPRTGGSRTRAECFRITVACLVLLCVLLVTVITVLCKFSSLSQTDQYNNNNISNLTIERDHLQRENLSFQKILDTIDAYTNLGWKYFNYSVYYISPEKKNWSESRLDCKGREADLAIVNNREEQDFINKVLYYQRVWIGLTDRDAEGEWTWVDGTAVTVDYWAQGEPDNYDNKEHCAEIFGYMGTNSWTDVSCSDQEQWICEKNLIVTDLQNV